MSATKLAVSKPLSAPIAWRARDHVLRSFALDGARHLTQFRLDDETVAVLRHDVTGIG